MKTESKSNWVKAVIGTDLYKTELSTSRHNLVADEPAVDGGQDLGPMPSDFLRMSLASCTAITLRMYANRKGYAIDKIEVYVETEKQNDATVFHRQIKFHGTVDEEQKKRLLQIANACPIHKTLTNPIEIVTTML